MQGQPWSRARDIHWGQGFQLVEDYGALAMEQGEEGSKPFRPPVPLRVKAGEELRVTLRFAKPSRHLFQVLVQRAT